MGCEMCPTSKAGRTFLLELGNSQKSKAKNSKKVWIFEVVKMDKIMRPLKTIDSIFNK